MASKQNDKGSLSFFRRLLNSISGPSQRPKVDVSEYEKELKENRIAGLKKKLSSNLQMWKYIKLDTAVTGRAGVGKSSFINSIRGLKPGDHGTAKVGCTQTTIKCTPYQHPRNSNFIVWDLPGVGTPRFPKDNSLKEVEYDHYKFFLIIGKDRFSEEDLWLAREIQKRGKKFIFVCTNIDQVVKNDKRSYPMNHNETTLLVEVRLEIQDELEKGNVCSPKVFLIDNWNTDKFEFGALYNYLLSSFEGLQKDAFALSLTAVTKEVLTEKKRVLSERIASIALKVTCSKEKHEQRMLFQDEIRFYQKQFDIDDDSLAENKEILELSDDFIREYEVEFDSYSSADRLQVQTPTAMREQASTWEHVKDLSRWTKENKLLYKYCEVALHHNLDILFNKALSLYDTRTTEKMVKTLSK